MKASWRIPVDFPGINERELHIWKADIRTSRPFDTQILDEVETARMRRFHFESDRMRFIISHQSLRQVLAGYLKIAPGDIEYSYTKFGKPYLKINDQYGDIEFNLSHSGDIVLIGVTKSEQVGIDVEKIKPIPDVDQLVQQYFAAGEQMDLSQLSGPEKVKAFFRCWTRKEAVIKACGEGLSMPLDSFRVSLLPGELPRLIESEDDNKWMLIDINPADGYAAAAAAPIESIEVCYYSTNF